MEVVGQDVAPADDLMALPAGSLYGAKITQAGAAGSVGNAATTPFTIKWVLLGRTNQVSFRACDVCMQARMIQQRSPLS